MNLRQLLVRRVILTLPGLVLVATVVFLAMRVLPGDPAATILGEDASPEAVAALRTQLGLDDPLLTQYAHFLGELLRGDLGRSLVNGQPVTEAISSVMPHTVILAVSAILVGVLIGIPVGVLAAVRERSSIDTVVRLFGALVYSVPVFYSGILLLVVFGIWLKWFPVLGAGDIGDPVDYLSHLVLPALSLGIIMAAYVMRVTRASVAEVLSEEYIRAARAKGVGSGRLLVRHALRNAMVPIITIVTLYTAFLLTGAVLTETVFNRPGLGKLLIGAIQNRDYTMIQATLVLFAAMVMMINLITDLLYLFINPTLRGRT